jgi:hypothetical protein
VPLNSPRLLIRLRRCRKSGTVPLNSPRLLIRHRIPSTGLRTDNILSCKRSLHPCPTQTDYAIQTPSTTRSGTTRPLRETQVRRTQSTYLQGDPTTSIKTQCSYTYYYRQGPHPKVQPIISSKPLISLRSKHRHAHSFNNFNSATCIHVNIAIPPILHFN